MIALPRVVRPVGLALLVGWLVGCSSGGEPRAVVRGKLLDNGQPFVLDQAKMKAPAKGAGPPPGSRPIQVSFIPAEGGDTFGAIIDTNDWTFEVRGHDGKGIKAGKYKVALTGGLGGGAPDYFGGKYGADKTTIVREVKLGEEVVIDVSKP